MIINNSKATLTPLGMWREVLQDIEGGLINMGSRKPREKKKERYTEKRS
jgi:hypothetical protein